MGEYQIIAIIFCLGSVFVGGAMITSKLISFRSPENSAKTEPYECGSENIGSARIQFKIGFYLFALLFVVFDVETLFLFPCAKIFRSIVNQKMDLDLNVALMEIAAFILILCLGLLYAWKKKVLRWD